jgi:copper resistance protein B
MSGKRMNRIAAAVLLIGLAPAYAEETTTPEMDHSQMGHGPMDHGSMQGGSAPPDARDPHAYSDGLVFGPDRQLKMADEQSFHSILIDRLESARARDRTTGQYDLQAWFGRDYDRLVFKAEGEFDDGRSEEARTELLWGHAVAAYWDAQVGVRHDGGVGPDRGWLAFGVQGLAPYWFEVDVAAYVGDKGRTALRLEAEYELLLTQKLILQPRIEANIYGKRDAERGLGSGLSGLTGGLRLRYEIRRELAPYVGVEWTGKYGATADYARAAGADAKEMRLVAGLRFWY